MFDYLSCRRGEEHSFILKPATMVARDLKSIANKSSPLQSHLETSGTNMLRIPKNDNENDVSKANKYAVLVSFRCNFSGNMSMKLYIISGNISWIKVKHKKSF